MPNKKRQYQHKTRQSTTKQLNTRQDKTTQNKNKNKYKAIQDNTIAQQDTRRHDNGTQD